jgi:hypothetical protein
MLCHYCREAPAVACIFYAPMEARYTVRQVEEPLGGGDPVPYACLPCAEARRDEIDKKDAKQLLHNT